MAEDPNSTLFDDDKVNDDTANGMAIEEAKVEETTIVPPPALPEMEESLNGWLCTNCNSWRPAKKKRCGKCSRWKDGLRNGSKKSKGSHDTSQALVASSLPEQEALPPGTLMTVNMDATSTVYSPITTVYEDITTVAPNSIGDTVQYEGWLLIERNESIIREGEEADNKKGMEEIVMKKKKVETF